MARTPDTASSAGEERTLRDGAAAVVLVLWEEVGQVTIQGCERRPVSSAASRLHPRTCGQDGPYVPAWPGMLCPFSNARIVSSPAVPFGLSRRLSETGSTTYQGLL